ncbi:MAG: hypothetical protein PHI06_09235 [Desulfobulbaceae bacterium]|nr:hypothetical protein [Desulfobulbaceae bacterium]
MSNDEISASLGDFASVLVREISQSLLLAATDAPLVQVHTVRIRFGQAAVEEGDSSLLAERYPFLENGWQVEMEMDGKVQAQLAGQPLLSTDPGRPLLAVFGDMPLISLKGINTEWAKFFDLLGVTTISALAALSQRSLSLAIERKRSVKLWEYVGKARMLELCIPALPATPLDGKSIYALHQMTPAKIIDAMGRRKLSTREADMLMALLSILAVAIDGSVLRGVTLGQLLLAPPPGTPRG